MSPELLLSLFATQLEDLGSSNTRAILCRRQEKTVACALHYRSESEVAVRAAGLDYESIGLAGEYFETTYYQAVDWALEFGIGTVSLGLGTLRAKAYRGAHLSRRWGLVLTANANLPEPDNDARLQLIFSQERVEPSTTIHET